MNRRSFFGRLAAFAAGVFTLRKAEPAILTPTHSPLLDLAAESERWCNWQEDEITPRIDTVASYTHWSQSEIPVTNPSYFQIDDIVHCPQTGENMHVYQVGLLSIYVRRGIGSKTAILKKGEIVWILGNAGLSDVPSPPLSEYHQELEKNKRQLDAEMVARQLAWKSAVPGRSFGSLKG